MNLPNEKVLPGEYPKFINKTYTNCPPTKSKKRQYSLEGLGARLPALNTLSLLNWITSDKLLNCTMPQFPNQKMGIIEPTSKGCRELS